MSLRTSSEAREILERFRRATGIRPNLWARAALGYSLSLETEPEEDFDSGGSEFPERVLLGDDAPVLLALVRQRARRLVPEEELGGFIKRHVERGLRYFSTEYERLNRRGDELLIGLLERCARGIPQQTTDREAEHPPAENLGVTIDLGANVRTKKAVTHVLTSPGSTPHIAIMGRNGTGKTRTGLLLLSQIAAGAGYSIPALIFDYAKGDIAGNTAFAERIGATTISLPDQVIPLAPLSIVEVDEHSTRLAAHRFRDTVNAVVRLGPKQHSHCLQIIAEAYDMALGGTPDLDDLVRIATRLYAENEWPEDSLLACLREFSEFPLFRSSIEGTQHRFLQSSYIIGLHRLPEGLRKLTAFLVLDRLYGEIMTLPDAPLDATGNRQLRLIIVIDEAHHYLPCRQPTLEKIVREVRSKGVAVWLLSQSPDDFDQSRYNFAREMGLAVVFSCVLEKPRMLEAVLGGDVDPRRLSQLPPGVALTRVPGSDQPVEVQVWKP